MQEDLVQNAITCALQNNWKGAIMANLLVLKNDKYNIEALNRLAHAYFANGELQKAKSASNKVLKIDPNNNIAIKSLAKFNQGRGINKLIDQKSTNAYVFIEIPGKTKLTTLINLGSEKVCSSLNTGDEVLLTPHAHKVSVTTIDGKYIGKLTDDLSARLRIQIKNGNKYKVLVKSANKNYVRIFIKGDVVSFTIEPLKSLGEFSA